MVEYSIHLIYSLWEYCQPLNGFEKRLDRPFSGESIASKVIRPVWLLSVRVRIVHTLASLIG